MTEPTDPLAFLDPDCKPILVRMAEGRSRRRDGAVSFIDIRKNAAALFVPWNTGGPVPAHVETIELPGAVGPRRVRRYTPTLEAGPQPTLFYMHGGGWIIGDLEIEDRYLREIAVASGVQILSLDYALAPEHRFPVPLHDCVALVQSALERAGALQIDPARIGLGGASAGANLAIATASALRDHGVTLVSLLLNCGAFATTHESRGQAIDDTGPSPADMQYFLSQYLEVPRNVTTHASTFGRIASRPARYKTYCATIDPLRDDSITGAPVERSRRCQQFVALSRRYTWVHNDVWRGWAQRTQRSRKPPHI